MRQSLSSIMLMLIGYVAVAQQVTIKGTVRDANGERLPSAYVLFTPDSTQITTDSHGHFSVRVSLGAKVCQVTYVGYELYRQSLILRTDTSLTVTLRPTAGQLQEVVITGARNAQQDVFNSSRTSTYVLTQEDINALPVLGGEADVIKTLQLLPGTLRGADGSSDLFVRGGAADQNLVLLDDVPIYNTSHLFGFLSVFNPDVLDHVEAINGGFPAEFGGRLSSILNIKTAADVPDRTHVSGDVGVLASRLFIEQPLVKNKASIWVAGRRTYIDQVVKALGEELPYFFYDLNGKILLKPTPQDHIEISYYAGDDVLDLFRDRDNDGSGFTTTYEAGNNSQSARWIHTFNGGWKSELSAIRSEYKYNIRNAFEDNELVAFSDIEDYGARWSIYKDSLRGGAAFKTGAEWTRHGVSPNIINTQGRFSQLFESSIAQGRIANEFAAHAQYEWSPVKDVRINAGLRVSMAAVTNRNYANPEPRLSARYALTDNQALKLSYSHMVQYIHRISSSAVSSPTDIWYPVTEDVVPQTSNQVALAWQNTFRDDNIFLSVEAYHKSMDHLIGYEEGTNLFMNNDFESKLIQGKGRAWGLEVLLRKEAGRFKGWISYTLSWSRRQFDEVNGGAWFYSRYDRRHNGAIVGQYALGKRWAASVVWEFISGSRFTPIIGQYTATAPTLTGVDLIPVFSGINEVKLANAHRLDVGIKFKSRPHRHFQWEWFAGIYNAYNRANPVAITIEQDDDGSLHYEQPGLFGAIPFISYGFKF